MAALDIKTVRALNDGIQIPYLGLGVYASSTCTKACLASFNEGYRHIDTAQLYGNEAEVGVDANALGCSPVENRSANKMRHTGSHPDLLPSSLGHFRDLESMGQQAHERTELQGSRRISRAYVP